jgi:hypothetical protein
MSTAYSNEYKILYYQNDSVYVVNSKLETILVLPYEANAILSPDYKLVFYSKGFADWSVMFCTYNIESGKIFESQRFEEKNYFLNPQWSPTSDRIAYKTVDRDDDGNISTFIEGYNFKSKKLFTINLDNLPNPFFSYFCSFIDSTHFMLCDDRRSYIIDDTGYIIKTIDFTEVFKQLPKYAKPIKSFGDTLFYVDDFSLIYRPLIRDIYLLKNNIYILTATITANVIFANGISERAIFYYDENNAELKQLTSDSIAIENIHVVNDNKILFNSYTKSDLSNDGGWGDYTYHKSEQGEYIKNEYYYKKHIYEIDLREKIVKLVKENAILSRSQKE